MIYTKDNDVIVKNPNDDVKEIDGIHYGVICSVQIKNNNADERNIVYICTLYLPNIYGLYNQDAQNYPIIEIPKYQDNDDIGYVPQIGDLCKCMFEAGNSYTCKLIHYIYNDGQSRELNKNYILYDILPSDVLPKPTNPLVWEQYKGDFLDLAYYITTGHTRNELTVDDFSPCALGSRKNQDSGWWFFKTKGISAAKNYFCKALSIPFASYFVDINEEGSGIPIISSEYYNIKNIILDMFENHTDETYVLTKFFNNSDYDFKSLITLSIQSLYTIYSANKDITNIYALMYKITLACLAYINPNYIQIIFPDIKKLPDKLDLDLSPTILYKNYAELLWEYYSNTNIVSDIAYKCLPKFFYDFKEIYEKEWLSTIPVYLSGINNKLYNKNDKKLKHTIILCLTICPWLAYPLILYRTSYSEITLNDEINRTSTFAKEKYINFRSYSTYLNSDDEFTNIAIKLNNLTKRKDITPLDYIKEFRDIAYDVFGDGLLPNNESGNSNTWLYYEMDNKFNRLIDRLPKYLENLD